jgi:hypothetical protein
LRRAFLARRFGAAAGAEAAFVFFALRGVVAAADRRAAVRGVAERGPYSCGVAGVARAALFFASPAGWAALRLVVFFDTRGIGCSPWFEHAPLDRAPMVAALHDTGQWRCGA